MTERTASPVNRGLQIAVLTLAGIETALFAVAVAFVLYQALFSNEQLSRSIGWAIVAMAAGLFVLFTLPALTLGIRGRWLKTALLLAVLAVAAPVLLSRFT